VQKLKRRTRGGRKPSGGREGMEKWGRRCGGNWRVRPLQQTKKGNKQTGQQMKGERGRG